jgi:thioredoxin reductase
VLGRCRRRVLLVDKGEPRNAPSPGVNGFLTRDGCKPHDLRRVGREDSALRHGRGARGRRGARARARQPLRDRAGGGQRAEGRKLLLATGLHEDLPPVEGFDELFGSGVWNCPYCDGWENRDKPLAVYGRARAARTSPSS